MLPSLWRRSEFAPRSLARMEGDLGRFMERFFDGSEPWLNEGMGPPANIVETEKTVEASLELPGLKPENIHVEVTGDRLLVRGTKEEEKKEEGKTYHRVERSYGEFQRLLPLPAQVSDEGVEANYRDGVLTVVLPKVQASTSKKIEVKG